MIKYKSMDAELGMFWGPWSTALSILQEVEREISFRTESGLYYSYYKQMVKAKSISAG